MLVAPGCEIEREGGGRWIERHHHSSPYAAVVLSGGYVEAGDRGRIAAQGGDVLFHGAFDGHQDHFGSSGAEILNLPLSAVPPYPRGRLVDPDAILRLAERDAAIAAITLLDQVEELASETLDWPDSLASELRGGELRLDEWADRHNIAAGSVSRGFRLAYGVSPKRYRMEQRAAAAARAIRADARLAEVAFECGFSDQPHMTRSLTALFGLTPGQLQVAG